MEKRELSSFVGEPYRRIENLKRWELLFDDTYLVILDTGKKHGNDMNLVGVSTADLTVRWELGGELETAGSYDGIVNVWIKEGEVWAGTWSGFAYQINPKTGQILQTVFTK